MQSNAPDVTAYLDEVPIERLAVLTALRRLCLETLVGYDEGMAYGMPGYGRAGTVEVAFASQKNYISLYVLKQAVLDGHRDQLAGLNVGKGCIRYTRPSQLDFDLIRSMLEATRASQEPIC